MRFAKREDLRASIDSLEQASGDHWDMNKYSDTINVKLEQAHLEFIRRIVDLMADGEEVRIIDNPEQIPFAELERARKSHFKSPILEIVVDED